ncbi:MAG: SDR family NAD(P)-dependent oxidoreductase [Ferrimicrobium sp.]|jgi:3-hydroxy acid dehydrogenase/malonic semialdehyde reductase|uniref:SDR family NAD(P)-dependent oxidoreductase n=1 Tax=Ferrimicrobium acidiphilum TaxID=121039 RepID=A0ABV3Y229_9ACTN|nr:SDR family NAD(P)-dependent oxidoreductase [Ferrimicrobium sp.]MCL5973615.1 SDR family NAD(P)-dependent oxidoreductase [Actinomycetota bacterium]
MKALITGATSGIGEAIAVNLHELGYELVITGRREERLAKLVDRLEGHRVSSHTLDVTDDVAISEVVAAAGEVDVLVNNAGGALGLASAQEAQLSDWLTMIATNITGLTVLTHALLPQMVRRGSGIIINLGSVAGEFPYPGGNVYGATKAYVRQFSLNLKADLAGTGVRVTDIEPGMVGDTEFSLVRFNHDADRAASVYDNMTALKPADIADLVRYIVTLPSHVNINTVSLMPVDQGFGPFNVARQS